MPNKVKALVREVTFLDGLLLVYAEWLRDWRLCRFSFDQVPFFTFLARLHCRREKDMVCLLFVSLVRLLLFLRACIAEERKIWRWAKRRGKEFMGRSNSVVIRPAASSSQAPLFN